MKTKSFILLLSNAMHLSINLKKVKDIVMFSKKCLVGHSYFVQLKKFTMHDTSVYTVDKGNFLYQHRPC